MHKHTAQTLKQNAQTLYVLKSCTNTQLRHSSNSMHKHMPQTPQQCIHTNSLDTHYLACTNTQQIAILKACTNTPLRHSSTSMQVHRLDTQVTCTNTQHRHPSTSMHKHTAQTPQKHAQTHSIFDNLVLTCINTQLNTQLLACKNKQHRSVSTKQLLHKETAQKNQQQFKHKNNAKTHILYKQSMYKIKMHV